MFDIRYNILKDYVDKFIVVEALETFSGSPKMPQFQHEGDKVVHCIIHSEKYRSQAQNSPNTGNGEHYWIREFMQKEALHDALLGTRNDDIVFISDVDEIWNPEILDKVQGDAVYKPKQLPYMYYLNQRTDEDWLGWTGTVVTRYRNIKDACINHLRTDSMTDYEVVENGGWHFNSLGGKEKKREAFKHPVYENDTEWARREINMRIDESDLPQYLLDNKSLYKKYFL